LSSGNPLTFLINCLVNIIAMRFCYRKLVTQENTFHKHIVLYVGGDDNIFTTSKEIRSIFNELTIPKAMKEIGFEYTTETKGEALLPFRPLNEIEFLKRTFRKCLLDGRIVAPLRYDVIMEMPLWTRTYDHDGEIIKSNVITALREMSLWSNNTQIHATVERDAAKLKHDFEITYPFLSPPEGITYSLSYLKGLVKRSDYVYPDM
jgi:hypothetical protein